MMPVRRSNQTWLPSIFNDFFDNDWMVKANATAPAINVLESTEGDKEGKKESRYLRREFSYSKFQQTLILPDDVDKDKIDAKVNDGVLTIELPKRTPEDKEKAAKVIEVK